MQLQVFLTMHLGDHTMFSHCDLPAILFRTRSSRQQMYYVLNCSTNKQKNTNNCSGFSHFTSRTTQPIRGKSIQPHGVRHQPVFVWNCLLKLLVTCSTPTCLFLKLFVEIVVKKTKSSIPSIGKQNLFFRCSKELVPQFDIHWNARLVP